MTRRLLFSNFLLVLVTLFLFGLTTVSATEAAFAEFQETHTAVHTRLLVDVLENHYRQTESWDGVQLEILNLSLISGFVMTLKSAEGVVVGSTLGTDVSQESAAVLIFKLADGQNRPLGTLYVDRNSELEQVDNSFLEALSQGALFSATIVLSLGLVLGMALAHSINYPIRQMSRAAADIARGQYAVRVDEDGPAEVGILGRAFNHMAAGLQQMEQMRRDLVLNVSHDLRTPLTTLQGYLEGLRTGKIADRRTAEQAFSAMQTETTHLLNLVHSLGQVAALDAGQKWLQVAPVAVAPLIAEVVARAEPLAQAQGVVLTTAVSPDLPPLQGDVTQLGQMLFNLVENGVRHTAAGGRVTLSAVATAEEIRLTVADNGAGIAPQHQPFVFERFYRADEARSRHSGGAGLGLAIVQGVVQAHHGRITLTSEEGEGAVFEVVLPL